MRCNPASAEGTKEVRSMIEFFSELSGSSYTYVITRGRKTLLVVSLIVFVPLNVLLILAALNLNVLFLCFVPITLIVAFGNYFYKPKGNEVIKDITYRVKIGEKDVEIESDEKYLKYTVDDLKKIIDYGEFYVVEFYFPCVRYVVCKKDSVVEGTIEEFEQRFADLIVRKT